ncbi:GntR family transcriptional regulator [Gottfriedia solisilvae]|uniref:GntR family transcriptional regulator n=1 Tax=Gottfriedia solisilvae TaxID=1516104 RepID=A0A8J3API9_9BACI|nr:GntR family transcriptional regulator [Gottfriedia solisilvae]GGI17545.1 GntR family transcriptional regulator [Gottfriedia solisilvae]
MSKYNEIAKDIRQKISNQVYGVGEMLPDEFTLAEQYDCSKMTVKKAMDILVSEGLIAKRRGYGTIVKEAPLFNVHQLNRNDKKHFGLTQKVGAKRVNSKVLLFQVIPASDKLASLLNCETNSFIYEIKRVRYIDGKPFALEEIYMPISVIQGLSEKHVNKSIYQFIQEELGLKIKSAQKIIRAVKGNALDIQHLHIHKHDPVMEVEQIVFLADGKVFEYSITHHVYQLFEFQTVIINE